MTVPFARSEIMVGKKQPEQATRICMTPGCGAPLHTRGVCARCYSRFSYSVKTKQTSWRKLVAAGMVLKSEGRGRKNTTLLELNRRNTGSQ